jgi:glycerol-3-phosphate dehydrogenase (NAD(P)+)
VNCLAIIGAGSWGTALAIVLSPRFSTVRLWAYEPDLAGRMRETRENDLYLPGFSIPSNIHVSNNLEDTLKGADVVVGVMPSHLVRSLYSQMVPFLTAEMLFVSATKGLENETLLRPSEIVAQVISTRFNPRVAVLSGPTFAKEVAAFNPTAVVISSSDPSAAACIQTSFSGPTFRLYTSRDPIGVEIAASIKNVVAIAAGVLDGMGLGHNPMAALITRGLAEITRLAVALGGQARTLAGLAGLGDLVLTCTGELSRNRAVGIELARGRKLHEITGSMRMVAEGIKTTTAAVELARRCSIEMPITEQMYRVLYHGLEPREALRQLMERSLKGE